MKLRLQAGGLYTCMAHSRFQYVKKFELADNLLPDTFLVVRLDGHRFTRFTAEHGFSKPNDERGLLLMTEVMSEWTDLVMAFGQSDEFSFLLPIHSTLYNRRSAKLSTSFVSLFSSSFVYFWPKHFPDTRLQYPPNFDARVVAYPSAKHVRDYFAWRQADCHINNLYNTCFWYLVADGETKQDAQVALKGTTSGDKNEILFSRFNTNYNEIPQRFRKGTTLYRGPPVTAAVTGEKTRTPQGCNAQAATPTRTSEGTCVLGDSNSADAERSKNVAGAASILISSSEREANSTGATAVTSASGHVKQVESRANVASSKQSAARARTPIKKGHAPPGAIEEETSDLIRDDFWDRHPHLLTATTSRR